MATWPRPRLDSATWRAYPPAALCGRVKVAETGNFEAEILGFVLAGLCAECGGPDRKKERALREEPPTAPLPSEPCVSRALPSSLQCLLYSLFLPRPPGATLAPAVCPQWGSAIYYGCVIEMAAILQSMAGGNSMAADGSRPARPGGDKRAAICACGGGGGRLPSNYHQPCSGGWLH